MQVKSIAECSNGSILQYFRPALSYNLPLRPLFCLFLSGRLRQVSLYNPFQTESPITPKVTDMVEADTRVEPDMGLDARKPVFSAYEQQRRRPACASAYSDQSLRYSLNGKYHISTCYKPILNFLASLCS